MGSNTQAMVVQGIVPHSAKDPTKEAIRTAFEHLAGRSLEGISGRILVERCGEEGPEGATFKVTLFTI